VKVNSTAQLYAKMLEGYGVTHVFMVPAIFHKAMVAMEDTNITRVTTHHEVSAAYMADGYARASHRPGVVMGQSVGAANIAAGLRDAYLASSPVIAVSGGPHPDTRYRYQYQVIEDFPMFGPVTKFNAMVEKPERLADLLRQAFRAATSGQPGPVHLEIPGRLGEGVLGEGEFEVLVEPQFSKVPAYRAEPDMASVKEALNLLASAQRPVIVAGGGVAMSEAQAEVVKLAEKLNIPVATSPNGKGTLPETHPLSLGMIGVYGRIPTNQIVQEADVVFLLGCKAGALVTGNYKLPKPGTTIIQLDIDPMEIGRIYPAKVGILGDCKVTLQRMIEVAEPLNKDAWVKYAQQTLSGWKKEMAPLTESNAVPMRPERLCKEISACLPDDAIVVADTGHSAIWTGTMVELTKPTQRYIRCSGTLGWAFPASLGVKCAMPDRPVMTFTGDGGLCYHLAELETAARYGINTVVVVNNNRSLQQVKRGIDTAYGGKQWGRSEEIWVFRAGTNFARVAEELGCMGIRVEHPDEISGALKTAFSANRPVLVDVVTDIEAVPAWG